MRKICVDTDILWWYILGETKNINNDEFSNAKYLFNWFENEGKMVVIPSIVVGELLSSVDDIDKREEISDFINDNFEVLQYDIISARTFADIQVEKNKEKNILESYRKNNNVLKCKMKNDWNIASCAISNNCDAIFSNNSKDYNTFVGNKIPVFNLSYVEKIKDDIAEKEKNDKEIMDKALADAKEIQDGQLFPLNLESFPTVEDSKKDENES